MNGRSLIMPEDFPDVSSDQVRELLKSKIKAIYDHEANQIGTGVFIRFNTKVHLVTAKHVLFGHDESREENPYEKSIFINGLRQLSSLDKPIVLVASNLDLAVISSNDFEELDAEPYNSFGTIWEDENTSDVLSVLGFLSRDAKKSMSEEKLESYRLLHTSKVIQPPSDPFGCFDISYEKRVKRESGQSPELSPIPRGLSGAPVVRATSALLKDELAIVGVFVACDRGQADSKGLASIENIQNVTFLLHSTSGIESKASSAAHYYSVQVPEKIWHEPESHKKQLANQLVQTQKLAFSSTPS